MRTRFAAIAMAVPLAVSQASTVRAGSRMDDAAGIRARIEAEDTRIGHAIATRDFTTLERFWSPRMVVNSPGNNVLTRAQVFAAMHEDKLAYASASSSIDAFSVFQDVAIEMGHERIVMSNGPMAGRPLARRFTNVWQRAGNDWVQIARQATYVGIDGGAVYGHPDPTLHQ